MAKTLMSVRTNTRLIADYNKGTMEPEVEVVLLFSKPKYVYDTVKKQPVRAAEVVEERFSSSLQGLDALIKELQGVRENHKNYEAMANALNEVVEEGRKKSESEINEEE